MTSATAMGQIQDAIDKLRALTQVNVQNGWRCCPQDLPVAVATQPQQWTTWATAQLNAKEYIVWAAGQQVMWLSQQFVVPDHLQGYPLAQLSLRLALTWWAVDAQIFVNGQLVQQGDLFDSSARVLLSQAVMPGEVITVALRLVSPGHDIGALMRSQCLYEAPDTIDPSFVADELAVLHKYVETFAPKHLETVAREVAAINWQVVSHQDQFNRSLSTLRQNLQFIGEEIPKQRRIQMLGHAHLDMAWLWPTDETWDVAQRTFTSVLNLQQEFPELTFCHSTPAVYAWMEQHRPDLFTAIQQQIAAGRWEVVGGMWIEPELNLINGESIVRQVLYAQQYVHEKLGQLTTIAWVPDSFGFCWQLPQILKQGGIDYFVTQKLHWNDTTKFPYGAFWWQAPDGTQILSLMSPPNVAGVMDTNPITMVTYALNWETQTQLKDAFWLPGVGDHGGGPTRDMVQVAKRWQNSPFFPQLEFTTAQRYLSEVIGVGQDGQQTTDIPVWNDELYLEFHRGCYTTHADQKCWNRRCEGLLYQAEIFACLSTIVTGAIYPKLQLEEAWKKVLFNQFHDILPGTSIPQVFVEANQAWQEVEQVGLEILNTSLQAIASQITLPPPPHPNAQPLIVFNPLNWQRSQLVAVPLPDSATWEIYQHSGEKIASQLSHEATLLFLARDVPSVGYRVFWLCPTSIPHSPFPIPHSPFVLENEFLQVAVDPNTGDLSRIFDKINQREVLSGAGNQLQAFHDQGQYWDAWNIDPNYVQHPLPPTQLQSIQWLEQGELRSRLRVVRQLGQSQFCQDYVLDVESPLLQIDTRVDWQERHVLVKAAFPLNVNANVASYEIPCGTIQRPTQPQTPAEQAKWEVPALRWADLSDGTYGVSLLNNCKYGYDAQSSQLRLTLLRSSTWPDEDADRGMHHFTYAIYPHRGNWQSAQTIHKGYELNLPLVVVQHYASEQSTAKRLPSVGRLLDLHAQNLILMAFKASEDRANHWVLRCYECQGESARLALESDLNLSLNYPVNVLEQALHTPEAVQNQSCTILPWKIASFVVTQTS